MIQYGITMLQRKMCGSNSKICEDPLHLSPAPSFNIDIEKVYALSSSWLSHTISLQMVCKLNKNA